MGLGKPQLKYEEGKLKASFSAGLDMDKDGQSSVGAEINVFIDAKEAVAEIVKDGAPDWLKDLLGAKAEA